jgi:deferrochelatase/peroxidase EfeB
LAQQLVLEFSTPSAPLNFLAKLIAQRPLTCATASGLPEVQISLGFSRRGLERARVPRYVLACFAAKAPAFSAGAALRSASHLGHSGEDAPGQWDPAFEFMSLDAVISLHARALEPLESARQQIKRIAAESDVKVTELPRAQRLADANDEQVVHFGYRDGLSRVGIEGWTLEAEMDKCRAVSRHAAGEFVLGHPQNSGANPWIATAGQRVWHKELRAFFHNGSFGVLQQLEQHVAEFEAFVIAAAKDSPFDADAIKAKLCGRTPDGWPLAASAGADPNADFDYRHDSNGLACPFGSHIRRMNPRDSKLAQDRPRPLLRRGLPYGPKWEEEAAATPRGLMGQFFCASIEDQFEHLIGQWAERVPLGSPDGGGARDPLIGSHECGDGGFEIPMASGRPLMLDGLRRYTRTRGAAYLFYPSLSTLQRIAESDPFTDRRGDDD